MNKIPCTQCGHENEPERVYCHNCGEKLDRSLLPVDKKEEKLKEKKRKTVTPVALKAPRRPIFKPFIKCLIGSAVVAALILAALPPEEIPELDPDASVMAPAINLEIMEAMEYGQSRTFVYTQEDINGYLLRTVRGAKNGLLKDYVKFDRAYVIIKTQDVSMNVQQSIFGYPVYAGFRYNLELDPVKSEVKVEHLGGNLGRLKLHPAICPYADKAFFQIWEAFKKEKQLLKGLQAIAIQDGVISFVTKGPGAPVPPAPQAPEADASAETPVTEIPAAVAPQQTEPSPVESSTPAQEAADANDVSQEIQENLPVENAEN